MSWGGEEWGGASTCKNAMRCPALPGDASFSGPGDYRCLGGGEALEKNSQTGGTREMGGMTASNAVHGVLCLALGFPSGFHKEKAHRIYPYGKFHYGKLPPLVLVGLAETPFFEKISMKPVALRWGRVGGGRVRSDFLPKKKELTPILGSWLGASNFQRREVYGLRGGRRPRRLRRTPAQTVGRCRGGAVVCGGGGGTVFWGGRSRWR